MNAPETFIKATEVRPDFISKENYLSPDYARLERERLWPVVWQWACRLEEIPSVGDYTVYDICDQSVIVVRTGKGEHDIKAFHNVCPHRGRRLLSGSGHITKFHCIFHAWQWDLEGNNTRVLDHEQWDGCPGMTTEDLRLAEVHVAFWGGFVFINMSDSPESFETFIAPVAEAVNPLRLDLMRYCWYTTIEVESNWKVAQEAFMESYHVWGTHPQFLQVIDEKNISMAEGKHGKHIYMNELPAGVPSRRLQKPPMTVEQMRQGFADFIGALGEQVGINMDGQLTLRSIEAGQKAIASMPENTPMDETMGGAIMAMKEAAEAEGAYFPMLTPQQYEKLGNDWNIFPTMGIVPSFDGTLIFRALPRGEDPNKCTIEMISLLHYGKGKAPKLKKNYLDNWKEQHEGIIPPLLVQDLRNMEDVQRGMHSIALRGLRPNPIQEVQVTHFHAVLNEYLFDHG